MAKPDNQSPATKFIGAICLEAFATPFFEEGAKALFERVHARTAIAYSIGAVSAVAGLLTVANLQADNEEDCIRSAMKRIVSEVLRRLAEAGCLASCDLAR